MSREQITGEQSERRTEEQLPHVGRGADHEHGQPNARANVRWWQTNGGRPWIEEIARRRAIEPRYHLQERWLYRFFSQQHPMKVLEFGCGFGRHLKYLRRLGHLDLHGCDISQPMIDSIGEYLDDRTWAEEHTRVVSPDQPLPYPDRWFDMSYTSEVLIHVAPEDLDRTVTELLRVSDERLLLIENVRTQGERVDTLAHDGCWLHDFDALADRLGVPRPKVITEVIPDQHLYLFEIPARDTAEEIERLRRAIIRREEEILRLKRDAVRDSNALALLRDEADLAELRTRVVELSARIAEQQQELQRAGERERGAAKEAIRFDAARRRAERRSVAVEDELRKVRDDLERVENSLSRKLVRRAKRHRVAYGAARRVIDTVTTLTRRRPPEPKRSLPEPTFARIADRASLPTREEFMARAPRTVGICHPDWRGIRAATYALSDEVLEISAIRSEEHLADLAQFLGDIGPKVIVIHGIMPGASSLFPALKRVLPRSRLLLAYHGSPSQENFPTENDLLEEMIELAREKQIDALGFLKQGMAEIVRARGVSAYQLFNKIRLSPGTSSPKRQVGSGPQIGLFVPPVQHKNFYAQLLGALGMPTAGVHVLQPPSGSLFSRDIRRMVIHGVQPHADFLQLLGSMDVNLYVTLSECYPMTVLESLQLGVPCVTSDTSPIFDEDAELRELLVVRKFSDPDAITRQLERVLAAREEIARRGQALLARLNERADQLWSAFAGG